MGIYNGTSIISVLPPGLYNRTNIKSANLYVDGEFVRFKGQFERNLTERNAEEAVAATSFHYLADRVNLLATYIGRTFNSVYVFMDGKRPINKVQRAHNSFLNERETKNIFKIMCRDHGFIVVQLETGESELQMYLRRDRLQSLNVFFTRDSDMLSIMYGHKPTNTRGDYDSEMVRVTTDATPKSPFDNNTNVGIRDSNNQYTRDVSQQLSDSCVWACCDLIQNNVSLPMTMIGFDYSSRQFGFSDFAWRVFCVMCGTDFTQSILTSTMISSALRNMSDEEKKLINSYTFDTKNVDVEDETLKVLHICVGFFLASARDGALKKHNKSNGPLSVSLAHLRHLSDMFYESFRIYWIYTTTGVMLPIEIPRLDEACSFFMNIVKACRHGHWDYRKDLKNWARLTNLSYCLSSFDNYYFDNRLHQPASSVNAVKKVIQLHTHKEQSMNRKIFVNF